MTSLPAGNETVPSVTGSLGAEEPTAIEGTSAAGPTTGLESTDVAGPSSGEKERALLTLALVAWRWVSAAVRALASVKKQAQHWRISVVLHGGEETTAETTAVDSTPRTSQDILGDFAEDWLETLDKNKIKSISLFLCYHFVHAFSFTETKAAEYAAFMMMKSDRKRDNGEVH